MDSQRNPFPNRCHCYTNQQHIAGWAYLPIWRFAAEQNLRPDSYLSLQAAYVWL